MKKKTKIALVVGLAFIIGISAYLLCKDKNKEKPFEFQTDVAREEYINEFSKRQGESNEKEIYENAGGSGDINISNRGEILKIEPNIDIMLSTDIKVTDGVAVLDKLYKDTKNKSENELSSYYSASKEQLSTMYGITSVQEFKEFTHALSFIDGTKIISSSIVDGTLKKVGNVINFKLLLKTEEGTSQTYKIKVVITVIEGKKGEVLIYWR